MSNWGGKRSGAGRKALSEEQEKRKTYSFTLKPSLAAKLSGIADELDVPKSKALELILDSLSADYLSSVLKR